MPDPRMTSMRALSPRSWPEGLREILGAPFQFRAAGQLRKQPLQGPGTAARHEFLGPPVEEQLAFVDDDDPVANPLHHIQDVRAVNDRLAFTREGLDERLESHGGVCIQAVERFVEKY